MPKNFLVPAALVLFASVANANPEYVDFTVGTDEYATTATALIGSPSKIDLRTMAASVCKFTTPVDAPSNFETTVSAEMTTGISGTFIPLERTQSGVKAYISVTNQTAGAMKTAAITNNCTLPVGTSSTASVSVIDTFEWGKPTKLKLSDGTVVTLAALDRNKQVGMDFKKLREAHKP